MIGPGGYAVLALAFGWVVLVGFLAYVLVKLGGVLQSSAELVDDSGEVVGEVRSVAMSPRHGGVAIAMVRREVAPGATLHARWNGGECTVQIAA